MGSPRSIEAGSSGKSVIDDNAGGALPCLSEAESSGERVPGPASPT